MKKISRVEVPYYIAVSSINISREAAIQELDDLISEIEQCPDRGALYDLDGLKDLVQKAIETDDCNLIKSTIGCIARMVREVMIWSPTKWQIMECFDGIQANGQWDAEAYTEAYRRLYAFSGIDLEWVKAYSGRPSVSPMASFLIQSKLESMFGPEAIEHWSRTGFSVDSSLKNFEFCRKDVEITEYWS